MVATIAGQSAVPIQGNKQPNVIAIWRARGRDQSLKDHFDYSNLAFVAALNDFHRAELFDAHIVSCTRGARPIVLHAEISRLLSVNARGDSEPCAYRQQSYQRKPHAAG